MSGVAASVFAVIVVWMPVQPYASSSVMRQLVGLAMPGAAVLLRHHRRDEPELPGLVEDLHRELRFGVALGGDGNDALFDELLRVVDQRLLFVGDAKIHHGGLPLLLATCLLLTLQLGPSGTRTETEPQGQTEKEDPGDVDDVLDAGQISPRRRCPR